MKYHQHFTRIKPFVQQRTAHLIRNWRSYPEETRWAALDAWGFIVCLDERGYTRMLRPTIIRDANAGAGYYDPVANEIHMAHPSIITMLHEFRHAMQAQGFAGNWTDAEHDARGWSLSLYHLVDPMGLRRLVERGKVYHLSPSDYVSG